MEKRILTVVFMLVLFFTASTVIGQNLSKETRGATLTWATDEYRTANYSLKIEKTGTDAGVSRWYAADLYRYWDIFVEPDRAMEIGAWVKTSGVNTNPSTDAEKIQLKFTFFTAGVDILGSPVVLDVDQSTATSTGWMEVKNSFALAPSQVADSIRVEFIFGNDATGTAWVDDFFIRPAVSGGDWVGDLFNANVDAPTGWFYWWADFSAGKPEWDTSVDYIVTASDAFAHSGTYSAYIEGQAGRSNDFYISSDIFPITPGEPVVISAWMKAIGINADSVNNGPDTWATGFKVGWHNITDGRDGWGHFKENNEFFEVPGDTFDWTPFATVVTAPDTATGMSLRLWVGKEFLGATYWDDVKVTPLSQMPNDMPAEMAGLEGGMPNYFATEVLPPIGVEGDLFSNIPRTIELSQNHPNPFNPSTNIVYGVPNNSHVTLDVFNILGQRVTTLVNGMREAGTYEVKWDSMNDSGNLVSGGIYFYRLRAGDIHITKKMLLLK
ncbi:MAG: T9SS type A sorting domain-containing protein [Candidatus Marinimicrobia bacterium]|nr:T9SS type A sorting domain-containing protein [Candidatus Neomarinimicrobiota bacterium]